MLKNIVKRRSDNEQQNNAHLKFMRRLDNKKMDNNAKNGTTKKGFSLTKRSVELPPLVAKPSDKALRPKQTFGLNSQNPFLFTPLHVASKGGHLKIVTFLITQGADPNMQDTVGDTPLHLAARNGHEKIVCELLCQGADTSIRNRQKKTAADICRQYGHSNLTSFFNEKR